MDLNYTAEDVAFRKQVRTWLEQNMPRQIRNLDERKAWHRKLYEARLSRHGVAEGVRRPGRAADGAGHRGRRDGARGRARADQQPRRRHRRPHHRGARHRRPEAALPPEDPHRRGDVVPALLRAERGLRPGRAAHRARRTRATTSWSTARRSGRAAAPSPTGGCCSRAPIPRWPSTRASRCFLMNMRQPGVDVRPLKQITGSSEFCEVFMTNARVEKENQIGRLGEGWGIAQTTLGYERGGRALARITTLRVAVQAADGRGAAAQAERPADPGRRGDAPEARPHLGRPGGGALRRPARADHAGARRASRRGRLAHQALLLGVREALHGAGRGDPRPVRAAHRRACPPEFRLEVDTAVGDHGTWAYAFLWSRAGTIYAGSSEIQKNVIGERILGLPKESRADRVGGAR